MTVLEFGPVELSVSNLKRSEAFYASVLGLSVLKRDDGLALGVPGRELLRLRELPGASPAPRSAPGLFHFALLVPTRADLGRFVRRAAGLGVPLGQSDHLVSEAFYLDDPDGHGIEVYRDRPRQEWRRDGSDIRMANAPVDLAGLFREAQGEWAGMPEGTTMGHVHLRVSDLAASEKFYVDTLGLDVTARSYPGALFVSAGGYHHHFGLNVWHSRGGTAAPEHSARLLSVTVRRPGEDADVRDPSGNLLRFRS